MVPEGWKVYSLSEIAQVIDCKHRTPKYVESGIPLVSPGSIKWGALDLETPKKHVSESEYKSLMDHCTIDICDLVMSRNQSIGVASYVDSLQPFVLGQDTVLVKPKDSDGKYIYYKLQSKPLQQKITRLAGGSTFLRINLADIRRLELAAPPVLEQKKIAKIIFSWDKAITTTEQLLANSHQQKKVLTQQLLTGKRRLLDKEGLTFNGDWKKVELGDLLDYQQPTPYLVATKNYSNDFKTPVLTAGKTFLLGYTDEKIGIFEDKLPVIIFDDFTTASKYVDFPFKVKSSAMKMLLAKEGISTKFVFESMQMLNYPIGGHQRHWISIYSNLVIKMPKKAEQLKIVAVLTAADREIGGLVKKIELLKSEKRSLMQQLLTGKRRVKVEETV